MSFSKLQLTNNGIALHLRGLEGETITFTKISLGYGSQPKDAAVLTELRQWAMDCDIAGIQAGEDNVALTFYVSNDELEEGFHWSELGVFAKVDDGEEVLYGYDNSGDNTAFIPPNTDTFRYAATCTLTIHVGTAVNVSATVKSAAYARLEDFQSHINNCDNPHAVTKTQLGLANVENKAINDQTPSYTEATKLEALKSREKLSVALGKIALAVKTLISHVGNSAIHVPSSGALAVSSGGTGVTSLDALAKKLASSSDTSVDNYIVARPVKYGDTAPTDTNMLWIDSNATTGGLKYHNGSSWVHVPVAYT